MMNENNSFAMKSPSTKKYKSIAQIDNEESITITKDEHDENMIHADIEMISHKSHNSGDEQGVDKHNNNDRHNDSDEQNQGLIQQAQSEIDMKSIDDMNEKLNKEQIVDTSTEEKEIEDSMDSNSKSNHDHEHNLKHIHNDNISIHSDDSSASSYSSNTINLVKLNNDSDGTYNSFKIMDNDIDKANIYFCDDLNLLDSANYINNDIIFWLFTLKKMKIVVLSIMYKKFLQTIMALNMVTVIIYIAFIYEYNVDFMNAISTDTDKYEILFSLLINSNIVQAIIVLIEYYSSALRMNYNGFVYPVFIGICYSIMSVIFSVSQFDMNNPTAHKQHNVTIQTDNDKHKIQIDNLLNISIGKIYLTICCDWIGNPMHALLHVLSIILVLVVFHILFTFTKNIILSHIWSYHDKHHHNEIDEEDKDIAMNVVHNMENNDMMTVNGYNNSYNIVNDGNNIKIVQNQDIYKDCDINMDVIEESSIVLDASVSQISSSIVEVQYDHNKHHIHKDGNVYKAGMRSRIMSASEIDFRQNLPVLEEDDNNNLVEDILKTPGDDSEYLYNEAEGVI